MNYAKLRSIITPEFRVVRMFDLRRAALAKAENKIDTYMRHVKECLADCMVNGGLFMLNIDDSPEIKYEEKFDPHFLDFYKSDSLPIQIRSYSEIKPLESFSRVLKDTPLQSNTKLNPNFYVSKRN